MPPIADPAAARRAALQCVETTRLLGVDFLPRPRAGAAAPVGAGQVVEPKPGPDVPSAQPPSNEREARQRLLDELRAEHDRACPHCTRARAHSRTVFGEGDPCAALMFVGEAPGAEEDRTGRPFVGAAGKKLDEMIRAMGLSRESVYIANVLKARPPDNATPTPEEAANCGPFLRRQIGVIRPSVIVTLGRPATRYLLASDDTMTNLRGRWAEFEGIAVMPTFHPAYLLRAYTPENRRKVWSDLQAALQKVAELRPSGSPVG